MDGGNRMAFGRRGELAEGPPHPYMDAYATLTIFCRSDSLPAMAAVVLEEGPFVRNIEGEARVARAEEPEVAGIYGPTHAIRWISRPPGPTIAVLADPDRPDMWPELRTGHHLMAVVPTSGGTHHYRFNLGGFASQEERCLDVSGARKAAAPADAIAAYSPSTLPRSRFRKTRALQRGNKTPPCVKVAGGACAPLFGPSPSGPTIGGDGFTPMDRVRNPLDSFGRRRSRE